MLVSQAPTIDTMEKYKLLSINIDLTQMGEDCLIAQINGLVGIDAS